MLFEFQNKKPLAEKCICQGRIKTYPRCHLDSHYHAHFQDTNIPQTINACPSVAEYSPFGFDCTLRGPFAKQCLTRFTASRALCVVFRGVISASTVYVEYITSFSRCQVLFAQNFFPKGKKYRRQKNLDKPATPVIE